MIGSIRGKIIFKTEKFMILEAVGVGYKIYVSPDTLSQTNSQAKKVTEPASAQGYGQAREVFLFIHTHVREDAFDLYGFLDKEELAFFEMLIGVSGIGPKGALAILGLASLETLERAIGSGDTTYLTKISGIGKKTAEKIVIELRDKLRDKLQNKLNNKEGNSLHDELDALEALKSLGYSQNEAREALKKVTPNSDTNTKIREALKVLGK